MKNKTWQGTLLLAAFVGLTVLLITGCDTGGGDGDGNELLSSSGPYRVEGMYNGTTALGSDTFLYDRNDGLLGVGTMEASDDSRWWTLEVYESHPDKYAIKNVQTGNYINAKDLRDNDGTPSDPAWNVHANVSAFQDDDAFYWSLDLGAEGGNVTCGNPEGFLSYATSENAEFTWAHHKVQFRNDAVADYGSSKWKWWLSEE
ncbi:MAG: hypothetical protein LBR16_06475 [Treponema sp.]|jgi:hypothetical protein|nr:hypothetical protein [Treponema sp.]